MHSYLVEWVPRINKLKVIYDNKYRLTETFFQWIHAFAGTKITHAVRYEHDNRDVQPYCYLQENKWYLMYLLMIIGYNYKSSCNTFSSRWRGAFLSKTTLQWKLLLYQWCMAGEIGLCKNSNNICMYASYVSNCMGDKCWDDFTDFRTVL